MPDSSDLRRHRGLERVEALVRAHLAEPVAASQPRRAVTVVLLREGTAGLEAFLLDRAPTMAFAAGQTVFPGGSVDAGDASVARVLDPDDASGWASGFDCDETQARALLVAAAREVFEETGVLLGVPDDDGSSLGEAELAVLRTELLAGRTGFAEVLAAANLVLTPRLLLPWSRWVTPEWSARRYDTYFFVAALPAGQVATDGSGEAVSTAWRAPAEALARVADGRSEMFTPTVETLIELGACESWNEVATTDRDLGRSTFSLTRADDRVQVRVDRPGTTSVLLDFTP